MPRRKQCSRQNDWCPSLLLFHSNYLVFHWQLVKLHCTHRSRMVCQESGLCVNKAQSQMPPRGKSSEKALIPPKLCSLKSESSQSVSHPAANEASWRHSWISSSLDTHHSLTCESSENSRLQKSVNFFKFFPGLRILIR